MTMTADEVLEPVLNDNEEPCWLTKTIKKVSKANNSKSAKEIIKENKPLEEVLVFELKDAGLWECRRCGAKIKHTNSEPSYCSKCERDSTFDVVTETINPDLWKFPKWEDIPVDNLDMLNTYNDAVDLLRKTIVFVEDIQYKILALWIFSTWKLESWNTVGTPFFVGLVDSGKTKGLDVIRELAWRMIHAANCKFTAMVRGAHFFNAGILLDEVEFKLNTKTERGQEMLEFIKPGYRRGSKYCVADKEDQKRIISYNNYGFKALAGEILYDKGMKSRCIPFEMEKGYPEIEDMTKEQDEFDRIQTILLNYRYKTSDPPELPEDCPLHGRVRELFESPIRTGMHIGLDVTDVMAFAERYEKEQISEFQNSIEREILEIIYNNETLVTLDDAPEMIELKNIRDKLEWDNDSKALQKLGYILRGKNMGLHTFHTRDGAILKYVDPKTRRKLTYLYKRYGVIPSD